MSKSFDVIEQPWIGVTGHDGKTIRISLREALTNSAKYRCLSVPSQLERISVLRMLCAFDFRILYGYMPDGSRRSVSDADDVMSRMRYLLKNGGITDDQLNAYVHDCNESAGNHTRFDALDDEMPFLQSTERKDGTETLAGKLRIRVLNSKNKARYHTPGAQNEPVQLEDALTALTTILSFDDAGIKAKPGDSVSGVGPLADHALVYFTGNNLLEDIVYNLCLVDEQGNLYGDDKPVWELSPMAPQIDVVKRKEDAEDPEKGRPRNSPAAFYAPRGRRPLLMMNENGMAVGMHNRYGDRFAQSADPGFTDPMKIWQRKEDILFPVRVFRKDDSSPAWLLKQSAYQLIHMILGDVASYDPAKEAEKKKQKEIDPEDIRRSKEEAARTPSVVTWARRVMDMTDGDNLFMNLQGLIYGPQSSCIADTSLDTIRLSKDAVREDGNERKPLLRFCSACEQIVFQMTRFGAVLDDVYHDTRQGHSRQVKSLVMTYADACAAWAMENGLYDEALRKFGREAKRMVEEETFSAATMSSPDNCEKVFRSFDRTCGIITNLEKRYTSDAAASTRKGTVMLNVTESVLRKKILSVIGKIQSNSYEAETRKTLGALCRATQINFYTDAELSDLVFSAGSNDQEPTAALLGTDVAKTAAFALRMYGVHQKGKNPASNPMHVLNTKENGYRFTFGSSLARLANVSKTNNTIKKYTTAILGSNSIEQMEVPCRSLIRELAKENIPMDYCDFAVFIYRICYGTQEHKQNAVIRFGSDAFGKASA